MLKIFARKGKQIARSGGKPQTARKAASLPRRLAAQEK
jgi:hypothetical protein